MFANTVEEVYEHAASGLSYLTVLQQQYAAAHKDRKRAAVAAVAVLLMTVGVYC